MACSFILPCCDQSASHAPCTMPRHRDIFPMHFCSVKHREICVKYFSGTTAPRILKFGTNIGYDLLYCIRDNQHPYAYHSLNLSIFLFLPQIFSSQISQLLSEPEFSNFLYTYRGLKYIVIKKTTMMKFNMPSFFHLSLQYNTKGNLCQRFLKNYCTALKSIV